MENDRLTLVSEKRLRQLVDKERAYEPVLEWYAATFEGPGQRAREALLKFLIKVEHES